MSELFYQLYCILKLILSLYLLLIFYLEWRDWKAAKSEADEKGGCPESSESAD